MVMANLRFIRCEDGSYVLVQNITRLSIDTDYTHRARIKAHTIGPAMPFTVAEFETVRAAQMWLLDLVERLEHGNRITDVKKEVELR